MGQPTHEDAQLLVQLARLSADLKISEAAGFLWSDDFVEDYDAFKQRFPFGSEGARHIGALAGFHETVATLVKHDLLNEELVRDWLGMRLAWNRLEKIMVGQREESGEPRLWENFEALATARA